MTGVIWIVQIVIYPQLRNVPAMDFVAYEKAHMARIGMVVGPMMLLEFFTALILFFKNMLTAELLQWFYFSIVLGIIIGISTAVLQAPLHGQLAREGKEDQKIKRLISTNWIRTISWTGRSLLIGWIVLESMQ
jgi:hypothetical protein